MSKRPIVWICLADGAHAKIVTPREPAPGYETVTAFDSPDAHHLSHDLGSERPSRTQESANAARHAIEPRIDPHAAAKHDFIRVVIDFLDRASAAGDYDELMLFAPPTCLHELRTELSEATRRKITRQAPKDLTKIPFAALAEHIAQPLPHD